MKETYTITLSGRHDSTQIEIELSTREANLARRIAAASVAAQPVQLSASHENRRKREPNMRTTIDGQPVITAGDLKVGESGFIAEYEIGGKRSEVEKTAVVLPAEKDFRDGYAACYRITRTPEGVDLTFMPYLSDREETLVISDAANTFWQAIAQHQEVGWQLDKDCIIVSSGPANTWRYLALMYRTPKE